MWEIHAIDDTNLGAVLEVFADPREVDARRNAKRFEHRAWLNAGQHQELWGVERAAAQDNLTCGLRPRERLSSSARLAIGPVEPLALQVFDAGRPVALVEYDAGDQRVELDLETVGMLLGSLQHPLAGAHSGVIARRQWGVAHPHAF